MRVIVQNYNNVRMLTIKEDATTEAILEGLEIGLFARNNICY